MLQEKGLEIPVIPDNWKQFEKMLTGPRTIPYNNKYVEDIASKLRNIRMNPKKCITEYYNPDDHGSNPLCYLAN